MTRQTLAFIVAPLCVPALVAVYAIYTVYPDFSRAVFLMTLIGLSAAISYGGTLVLGRPALAFMRMHRMTSVWIAIATGFAIGAIIALCLLVLTGALPLFAYLVAGGASDGVVSLVLVVPAAMGAVVGLTFWLIARPDRSAASP